jgi:hypothetical protein
MSKKITLQDLIDVNRQRIEKFLNTPIMLLLNDKILETDQNKEIFLATLQVWSNYFQRIMYARQAFCFEEPYMSLFRLHLEEEFGHDILLQKEHTSGLVIEDNYIDAAGMWFLNKMLSSSNLEKLIIVNLVLESCGDVFYNKVFPFFEANMRKSGGFFQIHALADEHHSEVGKELLSHHSSATYSQLIKILNESWDMLEIILDRIAFHLTSNQSRAR